MNSLVCWLGILSLINFQRGFCEWSFQDFEVILTWLKSKASSNKTRRKIASNEETKVKVAKSLIRENNEGWSDFSLHCNRSVKSKAFVKKTCWYNGSMNRITSWPFLLLLLLCSRIMCFADIPKEQADGQFFNVRIPIEKLEGSALIPIEQPKNAGIHQWALPEYLTDFF